MSKKEWKLESYKLNEYPEIESELVEFPKEIPIAYAVCGAKCGMRYFIVDGGPQVCDVCGKSMYRTEVRKYKLVEKKIPKKKG